MTTLVDTSVWVDYLNKGDEMLRQLLLTDSVCCHPFVLGELACGTLRKRTEILHLLSGLTQSPKVSDKELLAFIDTHKLAGKGLGFIDVHLLASAKLGQVCLWTRDKPLILAAQGLRLQILP